MKLISGKNSASAINLKVFRDAQELAQGAAGYLADQLRRALAAQGRVSLMLSGGSTPRNIYACLAHPELVGAIDWSGVHIFWSDERCVPPDHLDNNFRMARENLLEKIAIPAQNIHRVRGELTPQAAALDYEQVLRDAIGVTAIDLLLLGMGGDGHMASLFPGSPALVEKQRWVLPVLHDEAPPPLVWRVTVTLPLILAARQVVVIVAGEKKSARLQQALYGQAGEEPLPVHRLRNVQGELIWLVDQAAAGAG